MNLLSILIEEFPRNTMLLQELWSIIFEQCGREIRFVCKLWLEIAMKRINLCCQIFSPLENIPANLLNDDAIQQINSYVWMSKHILSEDFIICNASKLNFDILLNYQNLSAMLIDQIIDKIPITTSTLKCNLSEKILRRYDDKLPWRTVSIHQQLSETFMRDYISELSWVHISEFQTFSEKFIRDFADKLYFTFHVRMLAYTMPGMQNLMKEFSHRFASESGDDFDDDATTIFRQLIAEGY